MATKLNKRAYEHAKNLISNGKCVRDEKDDWSKHQPSAQKENKFIKENGFSEYGKWYLGIKDEENEDNKGHYKFPYGVKIELDSINIVILKMQQHICMA
jgi:hypothetical protein